MLRIEQTYHILEKKQNRHIIAMASLIVLTFITVGLDYLFAYFQSSSFYISESLLFSSFWLLFFPLLKVQWKLTWHSKKLSFSILIAVIITILHLMAYPAIVWLLSKVFYMHTFAYNQTFNFGLTQHFITLIIIYSLPLLFMVIYRKNLLLKADIIEKSEPEKDHIKSILVADINSQKTLIQVNDIFYFSANSPYINIHHKTKKYLHTATLKLLETQLDHHQFIRIHKSHIVNISRVVSYQSLSNGDYLLILSDDTQLRMSRTYATAFKAAWEQYHRVTTK